MIHHIKKCFDNHWVASFYCDSQNPESHLTGFVGAYDEDALIIQHISPTGYYDGFILVQMSDLFRIDFNGFYEKKINKLYELKQQSHPCITQNTDLFTTLLKFAQEINYIVSVEVGESLLTGFILSYEASYIHMSLLDKYGHNNGETIIASEQVISIAVDTSTEHDIQLLTNM